jgi:hypothetical protein
VVTSNDVNAFEPTQAYISANLGAVLGRGGGMKVTAGRMALNLGSRRLVAADDYRNAANNYTGLRVDGTLAGGYAATAIYMLPVARLADDPYGVADNRVELDKESLSTILWGGLVNHGVKDGVLSEASFYHFRERDWPGHATRDRDLDTAGLRFYRAPHAGRIDGEVEAMYQWGQERASTLPTAALLDVSATFFHAHIGYSFPHGWHPRVALEFDRASGDGPGATYGRFDTLYGMRRGISRRRGFMRRWGGPTSPRPRSGWRRRRASRAMCCSPGGRCGWPIGTTAFQTPASGIPPDVRAPLPGISSICASEPG